ncbi:hypothetical protein PNOK_0747600 [Pyrrhoderma noxium]|uniref:Uncharacterized protein n=1 Tax=Pyrrhoderma noxium TaxID=2282107 RepID=A0A286UCS0_9AGAM|nr:hypothetical protein PNOK_0747600 [Pyrrhoderma noxium]
MPPPKKQRLSASNPGASSQPPKPTSGVKLLSTAPEGSGTTASVYKAVSENPNPEFSSILGKEVAVKKISPENSGRECWDNEKRAVTHMPVDPGLVGLIAKQK